MPDKGVKKRNKKPIKESDDSDDHSGDDTHTDDTCGSCTKRVRERDDALKCDNCSIWFHIGCMDVNQDT